MRCPCHRLSLLYQFSDPWWPCIASGRGLVTRKTSHVRVWGFEFTASDGFITRPKDKAPGDLFTGSSAEPPAPDTGIPWGRSLF